MKKLFTLLALAITLIATAQAPQGFNYQATVRNSAGALITNQNVLFKFNIMLNSQTSLPVYSETHQAPTDDLGQVNLVIGTGTATTGTFSAINWGNGNYFLGIELNIGSGYVAMGTTQLLSVPYALYANSAGSTQSQGKTSIYLTGNITNAQATAKIAAEFGPYTENIYISQTTQLTSVDLSAMANASKIYIGSNAVLTNLNFGGLTNVYEELIVSSNPMLNALSLTSITNCNILEITNNPLLIAVSFPSLTTNYNLFLNNNALPIATINALLNKMLSVLPSTGKFINLAGQNPPAPPTGQGIIDKQTLIDAGNYVYTDNSVPTLTTTLTLTTRSSVVCGGNITSDGGATVTSRGVCWSTSPNPTVDLTTVTVDGAGIDVFSSFISSLTPATTYYLRAYATNSVGTSYGNEISFTTKIGFEGTYKVIQGEYWRSGVPRPDIIWVEQTRVIESVNSTTYNFEYAGPFSGNNHYFTVDASDNVKTPTMYNGNIQLLNALPLINCDENPSLMTNACGFSGPQNIVVRDNVTGKDRIYRTYGYNATAGSREFYEVLELIVN